VSFSLVNMAQDLMFVEYQLEGNLRYSWQLIYFWRLFIYGLNMNIVINWILTSLKSNGAVWQRSQAFLSQIFHIGKPAIWLTVKFSTGFLKDWDRKAFFDCKTRLVGAIKTFFKGLLRKQGFMTVSFLHKIIGIERD
jgi:hypothetical protein